jgi:hypothetical protein
MATSSGAREMFRTWIRFGSGFSGVSEIRLLMTTERAGLEHQRRDGCRTLPRRPTVGYQGLQRRANNPHKRTKVAIWNYRYRELALPETTRWQCQTMRVSVVTTEDSVVDPDPVWSAPFCRIRIRIPGLPIWIRIRRVPYLSTKYKAQLTRYIFEKLLKYGKKNFCELWHLWWWRDR